jgi:hypothetical protein
MGLVQPDERIAQTSTALPCCPMMTRHAFL